jgi:hypothetical protein
MRCRAITSAVGARRDLHEEVNRDLVPEKRDVKITIHTATVIAVKKLIVRKTILLEDLVPGLETIQGAMRLRGIGVASLRGVETVEIRSGTGLLTRPTRGGNGQGVGIARANESMKVSDTLQMIKERIRSAAMTLATFRRRVGATIETAGGRRPEPEEASPTTAREHRNETKAIPLLDVEEVDSPLVEMCF